MESSGKKVMLEGGVGKKGIANALVIFILLAVFIVIILSFYMYVKAPTRALKVDKNIREAYLSEDARSIYILLNPGINNRNFTEITFIISDRDGREYYQDTEKSSSQFNIRFKKNLWQWLFGLEPTIRRYDYEIKARDLEIQNFKNARQTTALLR